MISSWKISISMSCFDHLFNKHLVSAYYIKYTILWDMWEEWLYFLKQDKESFYIYEDNGMQYLQSPWSQRIPINVIIAIIFPVCL